MERAEQSETDRHDRGYLAERGWRSWAFTLDHKRIGAMYLWTTIFFFLVGGVFALLLRLELLSPQTRYFSNHAYNVFFTLHGAMMIFLSSSRRSRRALGTSSSRSTSGPATSPSRG